MAEDNVIYLTTEDGEQEEFYVLGGTRINGVDYLAVTPDPEGEDGVVEYYIMKDISAPEEKDAVYVMVEEDAEYQAVADLLEQELSEDEE